MKAIIHIGAPKTGSSSIQLFLIENVEGLARQGVRYGVIDSVHHSQLEYPMAALANLNRQIPIKSARARYEVPTLDAQKEMAAKTLSNLDRDVKRWTEPVAVFSSEHMVPWLRDKEAIKALDDIFAQHFDQRHYILYIRNQLDLVQSSYSEFVKRGGTEEFEPFFKSRLQEFDYHTTVQNWSDAIGRDRLNVRLMDKSFLVNGDVIDDFCQFCGIDPKPLQRPSRANKSLSAAATECLLAMNKRIPEVLPKGGFNPLRKGLVPRLMQMSAGDPPLQLDPELRKELKSYVKDGNERIRRSFFPDRDTLFSEAPQRPPPPDATTKRRALDLMTQLFIKLRLGEMVVLDRNELKVAHVLTPDNVTPHPKKIPTQT
ncbi:hypothetical protein PEL8287_00924 [Roseovarius litorisediminis]|uniref:Sulfotransferase family protein n=1 Tax=Roseovarius litorisediminis TaxID=1312363 RepID=A0A1Y5RNF4_9RHOB|nr:hypothetical protein [Roseovarius litorisediminis]SLN21627.1 hypothetical protein PEL8287_00924 [Roseovarius litorisediminis]